MAYYKLIMTEENFVDYVKLIVKSGNGGKGSMHLHREKFITKGGPDGGDGGREVILLSELTPTFGLSILLSLNVILMLDTEEMEVKVGVLELRVRIYI